jgi:SH3-like domain-containing protein
VNTLPPLADTLVVPPPVRPDAAMPESAPTPEPRRVTTSMLNRWTLTWTNLREGPGSEYAVVRVLRPGARVQVADVTRGWWAVYRDGALEGYVANSVLGDRPLPPDSVPGR